MTETDESPTENSSQSPNKRVNYTQGMLLTAQDFQQEQDYFKGKDAIANRYLHGYGTVCGLKVRSEMIGRTEVNIHVDPGYALNPAGNWIWVPNALTARLNEWVQNNREAAPDFAVPGANHVYVTLCYDEVAGNGTPVLDPDPADALNDPLPTRILETYQVQFSWEPPRHLAQEAAAQFGSLMNAIVRTEDRRKDNSARFLELVASLGEESAEIGLHLAGGTLFLWQETAEMTIREALVSFVTEVCPRLQQVQEQCVLLAKIHFYANRRGHLMAGTVWVDNTVRPILLPAHLQQELFFRP